MPYALDAQALSQLISGSKSFGPLTINYHIDLSVPQVSGNATLFGVSIGSILINTQNPTVSLGGSVGFGKADLTLTANFAGKELDYDVDVEAVGHTVYKGSGKLFTW